MNLLAARCRENVSDFGVGCPIEVFDLVELIDMVKTCDFPLLVFVVLRESSSHNCPSIV